MKRRDGNGGGEGEGLASLARALASLLPSLSFRPTIFNTRWPSICSGRWR